MQGSRRRLVRRSAQGIRRIVEEFQSSGLTRRAFCAERGLSVSSLDNWVQRSKKPRKRRSRLARVQVSAATSIAAPSSPPELFELCIGSGYVVRVPRDFDEDSLRRLLRVVRDGC